MNTGLSKVFTYASGVLAAVPGLTVLATGVGVPPGQRWLFGGVMEAAGVLFILTLILYKGAIRKATRRELVRGAGLAFACFLVALVGYLGVQNSCLVTSTDPEMANYGPVYFPLWLNGEIHDRVEREGGRLAVVNKYGPYNVDQQLGKMQGVLLARTTTTVAMMFLFALWSVSLAAAFGLYGFYLAPDDGPPP
jgi:hypothetical protein